MNIGPDDLESFIAVTELGSFRRAAERLGVSQPSVTTRIQRLERILGVKLLSRTTRRVYTTEAGERLRQRAEHTVVELRSLVQEFRDEAKLKRGRVSLAASPTVAASVLPPIIRRFTRAFPGVTVVLTDEFVGRVLERLAAATVDLAIIPFGDQSTEFDFEPLFYDEFLVVVPRDHELARAEAVTFDEISRHPLLCMPRESAVWSMLMREFQRRGLAFKPAFEAHNLFTLIGLVEAGLGLTLLPRIISPQLSLNAVSTVPISGAEISRHIGIVTLHGRALPPAAASFAQTLRQSIKQHPPEVSAPPARPATQLLRQ